jgi:hypothetical protein
MWVDLIFILGLEIHPVTTLKNIAHASKYKTIISK